MVAELNRNFSPSHVPKPAVESIPGELSVVVRKVRGFAEADCSHSQCCYHC